MKRSEMLKLIVDKCFTDEESARDILKVIEDAGMIPPFRDIDEGQYVGYINTWEPEND